MPDGPDGFFLQVGRVSAFFQDAFDHDADFGAGTLAESPVDGDAFADLADEFGGDDLETVIACRSPLHVTDEGRTSAVRLATRGNVCNVAA